VLRSLPPKASPTLRLLLSLPQAPSTCSKIHSVLLAIPSIRSPLPILWQQRRTDFLIPCLSSTLLCQLSHLRPHPALPIGLKIDICRVIFMGIINIVIDYILRRCGLHWVACKSLYHTCKAICEQCLFNHCNNLFCSGPPLTSQVSCLISGNKYGILINCLILSLADL